MKFEPIVANPDLDIHDDPPGLWSRVAIICRWKDAHAQRKLWPHAAVIGPLRTLRGLDEFIRNLLHNPQINTVLVTGSDLTPGEETTAALLSVWNPTPNAAWERHLGPDLHEHMRDLVWHTTLLVPDRVYGKGLYELVQQASKIPDGLPVALNGVLVPNGGPAARPRITLPPPATTATAPAPHGDPGERVAADTLGELWPMVLHRAMRFGQLVPTQYGMTRELLNLVAVIRDPRKSLDEFKSEILRTEVPPVPVGTWVVGYSKVCPVCQGEESRKDDCASCYALGRVASDETYDAGGKTCHFARMFHEFHSDKSAERSYREHERKETAIVLRPFERRPPSSDPEAWEAQHSTRRVDLPHPVLGITLTQAEAYHERVTGPKAPEGAPYSYGSRFRGMDRDESGEWVAVGPDQLEQINKLLAEDPGTRAAFATPWDAKKDGPK